MSIIPCYIWGLYCRKATDVPQTKNKLWLRRHFYIDKMKPNLFLVFISHKRLFWFCFISQGGSEVFLGGKSLGDWGTFWAYFTETQRVGFSWTITNRNTWTWRWCTERVEWLMYNKPKESRAYQIHYYKNKIYSEIL